MEGWSIRETRKQICLAFEVAEMLHSSWGERCMGNTVEQNESSTTSRGLSASKVQASRAGKALTPLGCELTEQPNCNNYEITKLQSHHTTHPFIVNNCHQLPCQAKTLLHSTFLALPMCNPRPKPYNCFFTRLQGTVTTTVLGKSSSHHCRVATVTHEERAFPLNLSFWLPRLPKWIIQ